MMGWVHPSALVVLLLLLMLLVVMVAVEGGGLGLRRLRPLSFGVWTHERNRDKKDESERQDRDPDEDGDEGEDGLAEAIVPMHRSNVLKKAEGLGPTNSSDVLYRNPSFDYWRAWAHLFLPWL
jgi:hypothetical protein